MPDCKQVDKSRARDAMTQIRNSMRDALDRIYQQYPGMSKPLKVSYLALVESTGDVSLKSASAQGKSVKGLVGMSSVKVNNNATADCEFTNTESLAK